MVTVSKSGMSPGQRKAHLKKLIHIGKSQIGWDDDIYRDVLVAVTRDPARNSSTQLTLQELDQVLMRMKVAGFEVRKSSVSSRRQALYPQASKIRALWLELHQLGYVDDASEKALAAWVKRMTNVDDLHWISGKQASLCIENLKKWQHRDRLKIQTLIQRKGIMVDAIKGLITVEQLCQKITGSLLLTKERAALVIDWLEQQDEVTS